MIGVSGHATMNEMFRAAARRRNERREGIAARLTGRPTVDTSRQASAGTLGALVAERERALQADDEQAVTHAEDKIDRLLGEARAGRAPAELEQPPPSFDGGVRGRLPRPTPGMVAESASQLLARSLLAYSQERRENEGRGQIANLSNF